MGHKAEKVSNWLQSTADCGSGRMSQFLRFFLYFLDLGFSQEFVASDQKQGNKILMTSSATMGLNFWSKIGSPIPMTSQWPPNDLKQPLFLLFLIYSLLFDLSSTGLIKKRGTQCFISSKGEPYPYQAQGWGTFESQTFESRARVPDLWVLNFTVPDIRVLNFSVQDLSVLWVLWTFQSRTLQTWTFESKTFQTWTFESQTFETWTFESQTFQSEGQNELLSPRPLIPRPLSPRHLSPEALSPRPLSPEPLSPELLRPMPKWLHLISVVRQIVADLILVC